MPPPSSPSPTQWLPRAYYRRIVLSLLILGALLRFVSLDTLPPAVFRDEAEKGVTAYSLATTGRDLQGHFLPVFINAAGVTTSAIYQYAAVPGMWLLGLNEWSARLPAAVVGTLTLLLVWRLVRWQRGREAGAWAMAFLALSPWHVLFSRWAQQGIFLPLLLGMFALGLQAFARGRKWGLPLAGVMAAGAMYAYDPARAFVPLVGAWAVFLYRRDLFLRRGETLLASVCFLVAASPLLALFASNSAAAQARFDRISIFGGSPSGGEVVVRFVGNYVRHWDPRYLLLTGDSELRHSAGVGIWSVTEALCFLAGVALLLRRRRRADLFWLGWLAAYPVAASLTREGIPHALRSIVGLPAVQVVAGIGAAAIVSAAPRYLRVSLGTARRVLALLVVAAFLPFAWSYFRTYRDRAAWSWQHGIEDALEVLSARKGFPPEVPVYISKIMGADYLVMFYGRISPRQIQDRGFLGTRYRLLPFDMPIEAAYARVSGPAAFVTLPIFPGPPEGRAIAIHPPSGDSSQATAVVYFNKPLAELLASQGKL